MSIHLYDSIKMYLWYYKIFCSANCANLPLKIRGSQSQFSENICWEDDLRSRVFGTFVVKLLACLALLGFSNI